MSLGLLVRATTTTPLERKTAVGLYVDTNKWPPQYNAVRGVTLSRG